MFTREEVTEIFVVKGKLFLLLCWSAKLQPEQLQLPLYVEALP